MDSAGSRTVTAGSEFHRPRSTLTARTSVPYRVFRAGPPGRAQQPGRAVPLRSRSAYGTSPREDIDGRSGEQDGRDGDVNPLALEAQQVEAVVDAADDQAAQDAVDGLAAAAEQAGAADDRRGDRQQHVDVARLDDVGGQRHLPGGEQHAGDPGDQGGDEE